MLHGLILLLFLCASHRAEATCSKFQTLITCQYTLPTKADLTEAAKPSDLIIQKYNGVLTAEHLNGSTSHSVRTLQIQRSEVSGINPGFFARISGRSLTRLTLSTITGTLHLDQATLSGLEDTLESLIVSDYKTDNTDYLYAMLRLKTLTLARTGLTHVPSKFPALLRLVTKLDLSSNDLTTMPWNVVVERASTQNFVEIKLNGNPWICDCAMKPVVQASLETRTKIIGVECNQPDELAGQLATSLKLNQICTESEVKAHEETLETDIKENESKDQGSKTSEVLVIRPPIIDRPSSQGGAYDRVNDDEAQLATAGSLSTEAIAIIVAIVCIAVLVLLAVIAFKVRARSHRRRQQAEQKKPSHKSNSFCHVIERPPSKQGGNSKSPGLTAATTSASRGHAASAGSENTYGRDFEENERQPLAPSYHAQQDRRL